MDYQIGEVVKGKIVGIKPYAFFMEFENHATGLLHISELSDKYVKDIEIYGKIGDELNVKILTIDAKDGFMRVSFKQVPENLENLQKNDVKFKEISANPEEFKLIQEQLPNWINETLKKMEDK